MTYNCMLSELILNYSEEHTKRIKKLLEGIEQQLLCYRKRTKEGVFTTSLIDAYSIRWNIKMLQKEAEALKVLWDTIDKQILLEILNER